MNNCKGACDQGRKPCPTPQACEVPEEDKPMDWVGIALSGIAAVMAVWVVFWVFVR